MNDNPKYGVVELPINSFSEKSFKGSYKRVGAKLTHTEQPDIRLVIGTRLKTSKYKPKHFLLLFEGRNRPNIYFSSLYPTTDPNLFDMEHQGIKYRLTLDSDKAVVIVLNQSEQAA